MLYYLVFIIYLPLFVIPYIICLFSNYFSYETERNIRCFNSFCVISCINQVKSFNQAKGIQRNLAALYRKKKKQKNKRTIEDVEKQFSNAYLINTRKELEDYRLNPLALVLYLTENILIKGEEQVANDVNHLHTEVIDVLSAVRNIVYTCNGIVTSTRFRIDLIFKSIPEEVIQEIEKLTNSFMIDFYKDKKKLYEYTHTLGQDSEVRFDTFLDHLEINYNVSWFNRIASNVKFCIRLLRDLIQITHVYAIRTMNIFPLRFCYGFGPLLNEEDGDILWRSLNEMDAVFNTREHLYFKSGYPIKMQYFEGFEEEIKNLQYMLDTRLKKSTNELLKHLSRVINNDSMGIICLFADILNCAGKENTITKGEFKKIFYYTHTWMASAIMHNLNGKERHLVYESNNFFKKFVKNKLHYDLHTEQMVFLRKSLKDSHEYANILNILTELASVLLLKKKTERLLQLFNYLRAKITEKTSDKLRRFINSRNTNLPNYIKFKHYLKFKRNVSYCNHELEQRRANQRDKEFISEEYKYVKFIEQYLNTYSTLLQILVIAFKRMKTNLLDIEEKNKRNRILLVVLFLVKKISIPFNS